MSAQDKYTPAFVLFITMVFSVALINAMYTNPSFWRNGACVISLFVVIPFLLGMWVTMNQDNRDILQREQDRKASQEELERKRDIALYWGLQDQLYSAHSGYGEYSKEEIREMQAELQKLAEKLGMLEFDEDDDLPF